MKYLFGDETIFESEVDSNKIQYCGAGILHTNEEIVTSIIDEALTNLKNDEDIYPLKDNPLDKNTLDRGYFHASEDSKNAHSHLCDAINKYVNGEFYYTYFASEISPTTDLLKEVMYLSFLDIFGSDESVKITVESRDDLSSSNIKQYLNSSISFFCGSIYDSSYLPAFFPRIVIEVSDKNNPGLQIVDFLLWATLRNYRKPVDNIWFSRLNKGSIMHSISETKSLNFGNFIINKSKNYDSRYGNPVYENNISPVENPSSDVELWELYLLIERTIVNFLKNDRSSNRLAHLNEEMQIVKVLLENEEKGIKIEENLVKKISILFIKLFDMIPLYNQKNSVELSKYLKARKVAALILRDDLPHGIRAYFFIENMRLRNNS
jgi:hypothetical protein